MLSQRLYLMVGILFTIIFSAISFLFFITGQLSGIEVFNFGAAIYMIVAIFYLYPQFKDNDERTKAIRQKGMYYTVFIVLFVLLVVMGLHQFDAITLTLTPVEIIQTILSLILITVWTTWILLSGKM